VLVLSSNAAHDVQAPKNWFCCGPVFAVAARFGVARLLLHVRFCWSLFFFFFFFFIFFFFF
jgi:hypothetical protein